MTQQTLATGGQAWCCNCDLSQLGQLTPEILHGLRMHLFFPPSLSEERASAPLSWHGQRYGVTEYDGSSMVLTRPLAKQETPTPSRIKHGLIPIAGCSVSLGSLCPWVLGFLGFASSRPRFLASLADGQSRHSCTTSAAGAQQRRSLPCRSTVHLRAAKDSKGKSKADS